MLEEEKKDQKNMMLAMVLIIVVLTVFNRLAMKPAEMVEVPIEETNTETVASIEPESMSQKQLFKKGKALSLKTVLWKVV